MGFPSSCFALAGRNTSPCILAKIRNFKGPEYALRTLAGAHICAAVYRRPPCLPRSRKRERRLAARTEKVCAPQKKTVFHTRYMNIHTLHIQAATRDSKFTTRRPTPLYLHRRAMARRSASRLIQDSSVKHERLAALQIARLRSSRSTEQRR